MLIVSADCASRSSWAPLHQGRIKVALFGISAKSDAEREPGFRQNHCVLGQILLETFRAGLVLKNSTTLFPETQWY